MGTLLPCWEYGDLLLPGSAFPSCCCRRCRWVSRLVEWVATFRGFGIWSVHAVCIYTGAARRWGSFPSSIFWGKSQKLSKWGGNGPASNTVDVSACRSSEQTDSSAEREEAWGCTGACSVCGGNPKGCWWNCFPLGGSSSEAQTDTASRVQTCAATQQQVSEPCEVCGVLLPVGSWREYLQVSTGDISS